MSPRGVAWWQRVWDLHSRSRVRVRACTSCKSLGQPEFYFLTWAHKVRFPGGWGFLESKKKSYFDIMSWLRVSWINLDWSWLFFFNIFFNWFFFKFCLLLFSLLFFTTKLSQSHDRIQIWHVDLSQDFFYRKKLMFILQHLICW
jgi:hypothetical protein